MSGQDDRGLFSLTIRRPVATTMFVLAVATFGFISMGKIPLELLPEISYPTITVRTEYQGAAPQDVEERISKRIEETLAVIPGLERHSSVSRAGVSDVSLQFQWGTNLSVTTQEIRERLDRTPLPDDAEAPLILRYDPSQEPVLRLSVYGERDLDDLREAAEEVIAKGIQGVRGVAAVKVRGGLETEIRVVLDEKKISNLGLDISEVDRRLKIENVNLASGTLIEGDTEYLVRTLNQFESIDEILELSIVDREGQPIRVRDVAIVERTHKERDVVTRVDGKESVELLVFREADANIVELAQAVRDRVFGSAESRALLDAIERGEREDPEALLRDALAKAEQEKDDKKGTEEEEKKRSSRGRGGFGSGESRGVTKLRKEVAEKRAAEDYLAAKLPLDVDVRLLSDQSRTIEQAISEVRGAAVVGGLLAVLVLLLFLKSAAATAVIAIAIPVSVIATFAPMFMVGTTLNIMSLGGLALGVGMLVDNSIVVLESIFRCREEGDARRDAAARGAWEVGTAVIASTLTTIAVFFPIAFVDGVAGQIFGDQALTVVFALLSSLVVALFFIPMLASRQGGTSVRPLRFLGDLVGPAMLLHRTAAIRGYRDLLAPRGVAGRVGLGLLLLPVMLTHLVLEIAGRVALGAAVAICYVALGVLWLLRLALRLIGAPIQWLFDRLFGAVASAYPPVLRTILRRPLLMAATFLIAAAAGWFGWSALRTSGSEMLPTIHQGEILVHAYLPVGTPVERSADAMRPIEERIAALAEVDQVTTSVGVARDEVAEPDEGSHSARILVTLDQGDGSQAERAATETRVQEEVRAICAEIPELVSFRLSRPSLFTVSAPLAVEAKGDDLDELRVSATELTEQMRAIDAITDVRSTVTRGNPEVHLTFDRERLRRFGLDIEAISNRIRAQVQGVVSTRFASGDRRIDVRVLADITDLDALLDVTVNRGRAVDLSDTLDRGREGAGGSTGVGTAGIRDRSLMPGTTVDLGEGAPIPLRQVADVRVVEGPSEIRRINGQRAAVVTANTVGLDVGSAVSSLLGVMAGVESRHPRILCEVAGQGAEMGEALSGMRVALLLAVFLVYLVMASQFESIVQPLIILLTVPLALVGAAFALQLTGTPISVVVLIGGIVLAGIVVNNAIVLVDYTNRLRGRGLDKIEALVEAGRARLRPILMTTLSTVLALLPLAGVLSDIPFPAWVPGEVWRGSELQAPLAVTVIGGLLFSTVLTLVVIPVVYRLVAGGSMVSEST